MLYLLHGDDELGQDELLSTLRSKLGPPKMMELNTTRLDGAQVTLADIQRVGDAMPFLAKRRLVVVEGLLSSLAPERRASSRRKPSPASASEGEGRVGQGRVPLEALQQYLRVLPETTVLVLREPKSLPARHPVMTLATELAREKPPRAVVREFRVPREDQLGAWVQRRARERGGRIERDAAETLAAFVGRDLRRLDQEIIKLVTYAGAGETIDLEVVQALVPDTKAGSIFDFVDAVARRETSPAISVLHRLLEEGYPPLALLTQIARQLRTIIQVKELQLKGYTPPQAAGELNLHPYVVEKAMRQGQNLSFQTLEAAYRRLLAADVAIKTGAQEPEAALDLLVVEICEGMPS